MYRIAFRYVYRIAFRYMYHNFELRYVVSQIEIAEAIGSDGVVFQATLEAMLDIVSHFDT